MTRKNEAAHLVNTAQTQGWRLTRTKHGWLAYPPNGNAAVFIAGTAQDHRSLKNALAALRRNGLRWPA